MEYAKLLQQSAGKSDYRESPLKTLMKVNELKKTINKDGRANIVRQEPYANRIQSYLSKEELKRKTNDGARKYLAGVRQYYNNIALGALTNDPEDQSIFLKEARKQAQQMKLLNDPSQVEYLKKVDPLGLFYLEKSFETQNQKVQEAMKDPSGDNLRKLMRGQPMNTPAPINPPSSISSSSSDTDSVFPYGLGALRIGNQAQLTRDARNALDRFINRGSPDAPFDNLSYGTSGTHSSSSVTPSSSSVTPSSSSVTPSFSSVTPSFSSGTPYSSPYTQSISSGTPYSSASSSYGTPPQTIDNTEIPIQQQHAQELMDENPILEPPEAFRQAERNIIDARPVAQELQRQELAQDLEPNVMQPDAEYIDAERELTMRAIDNALAKDESLDRFAFTEEVLNNPGLAALLRRAYNFEKTYYDTEYRDYERELTMRAINNALAKDRSLDKTTFTKEVLNNPELAESIRRKYVDEMIPSIEDPAQLRLGYTPQIIPDVIPSMGMLKKYGRVTLEKMAESHDIPYDGETTDSELRKRLIIKRKGYTSEELKENTLDEEEIEDYIDKYGVSRKEAVKTLLKRKQSKTKKDKEQPIKQSKELFFTPDMFDLPSVAVLKTAGIQSLRKIADSVEVPYDKDTTKKQLSKALIEKKESEFTREFIPDEEDFIDFSKFPTTAGEGFKPLSSYPKHIIAGALHIVKQRKKLRTNPNEYNREQAHHLTQKAIHGEGFFGDILNKINVWTFRNLNPIGRMITHFENQK